MLKQEVKSKNWFAYGLALSVLVIVYGAIPFFSVPDLGAAIWVSGFAKSFVNSGWPAIHAVNFGIPDHAPLVFGLADVFLQSTLMSFFHLHASDAYALGAVFWLALALWGSVRLGQLLGASFVESSFLSLVYLTLPIVWWHASYGSISFGFAFLPLYLYMGFNVAYEASEAPKISSKWFLTLLFFIIISLLSIFTDGYTYVMFYSACVVIWVFAYITNDSSRKILLIKALPIILISALSSYLLYTSYVGVTRFSPAPISFFRGWGVDLVMFLIPNRDVSWLWDTLGVSVMRSNAFFFGDTSVWATTYALPLLVVGGLGYRLSRRHRFAVPLLVIVLVGFYFSLGPSLKINSLRPADITEEHIVQEPYMPENLAVTPTGSEFIYRHIPGFTNMRATYRWAGLMFTGLFGLTILFYLGLSSRGHKALTFGIIVLLIVSNLPSMPNRLSMGKSIRFKMQQIDRDFATLSNYIGTNKTVFFAPPGNDLMVNYLASMGNYRAYNIGGDKNLEIARQNWPELLRSFSMPRQVSSILENPSNVRNLEACFNYKVGKVLHDRLTDFVVIPYFDLFYGTRFWPWPQNYVTSAKREFSTTIDHFKSDPSFLVKEEKLYTVISLSTNAQSNTPTDEKFLQFNQPQEIAKDCATILFLGDGWYTVESAGVWSSESAELIIPIGEDCTESNSCGLQITFLVFNASQTSPKTVLVKMGGDKVSEWIIDSGDMQERVIPLPSEILRMGDDKLVSLVIQVPEAISPDKAGISVDTRILGIYLSQLELLPTKSPQNKNGADS